MKGIMGTLKGGRVGSRGMGTVGLKLPISIVTATATRSQKSSTGVR